ncbi:uncharacterized protein LOC143229466 isoform X2 [Tachypleus tridentatus]|uniref:uncharacterized protein LOC143229466 isoform X2 n=1 Tax=Tachypleus tridentatus TaxID=6853 RepID=UPI003FD3500A
MILFALKCHLTFQRNLSKPLNVWHNILCHIVSKKSVMELHSNQPVQSDPGKQASNQATETDADIKLDMLLKETTDSSSLNGNNIKLPQSCEQSISADSHHFKNAILNEILNEKRMALLKSPEVEQFLYKHQMEKKPVFSGNCKPN